MSAPKEKSTSKSLQKTYENIKDLLLRIKPKLHDSQNAGGILTDELYEIASQAQVFTEQRPRSNKRPTDLTDDLDREGVALWNLSGMLRRSAEDSGVSLVGAMRAAAFRLIEAGLEQSPSLEKLGNKDMAASVLACAAKYEELLRKAQDPQNLHGQARACATIVYFSSRMEAAWRENNEGVAQYMLQKITEDDHQRLELLPSRDRELLASKILAIGQSALKDIAHSGKASADSTKAQEAVRWIQKAYVVAEPLEDSDVPGVAELKRSILRNLARAYFFSAPHDAENLARAETTLQELISSVDASNDHASPEFQELRWMRIAVLKRRNAEVSAFLDAFKSLIDHMSFTESTVTDLLLELKSISQSHHLLTSIYQHCMERAVHSQDASERASVDRLVVSLIVHFSKDKDHGRAMKDIERMLDLVHEADIETSKVSIVACLTLIWQYGNRHYHNKKWSEAADWFLTGSHQLFGSMASTSQSKCFRKAALCCIEQHDYARASAITRRCPINESATHYVMMLIAINQGLEEEAVNALRQMVKAPDFERKLLLLAVQLSHQAEMKLLLLSVLNELRATLSARESVDTIIEAVTLVRCSLRLSLGLLEEPGANRRLLVNTIIEYFHAGKTLVEDAKDINASPIIAKDASWLWRTAYNTAVRGCSEWEDSEDRIAELFDISTQLMEVYSQIAMLSSDAEICVHMANALFAALSARVFILRQTAADAGKYGDILVDIKSRRTKIVDIIESKIIHEEDEVLRCRSYLSTLRIFEVEMLCRVKQWEGLMPSIEDAIQSDPASLTTFEAIADILWVEKECPVKVLFTALEAILHMTLDQQSLALDKFSRWIRAICTILLSRNSDEDRAAALRYVEQAVTVLSDTPEYGASGAVETYPVEEREWLLSTSYNTGLECLHSTMINESKRWFETATVICRFVPDGQSRSAKISKAYTHLLARYSRSS